jgi:putative SOS response-associated peptidase YedK
VTTPYRLDVPAALVAQRFGVPAGADPWPGGAVSPGGFAPVITAGREFVAGPRPGRGARRMVPRLWGVPPPMYLAPSAGERGSAVFTVRNPDSPFWIGNLRNSEFRCLVPATAWLGWGRVDPQTGRKARLSVGCADQAVFAMAGVWKDSEVPSFAVLTAEASAVLRAEGVERAPVVLPESAWNAWLHAGWKDAAALIAAYPSGLTTISGSAPPRPR